MLDVGWINHFGFPSVSPVTREFDGNLGMFPDFPLDFQFNYAKGDPICQIEVRVVENLCDGYRAR